MKKIVGLLLISAFLCGCSTEQTVERVYDELLIPAMAPAKELTVELPEEAAESVLAGEDGSRLYFCDGYCLSIQTLASGDLNRTLRVVCGFGAEKLTLLETAAGGLKRWDWTWSCAGEGGTQVGRGAILDDGDHHYCLTVQADETDSGALDDRWDALFSSVSLER